MKNLLQAYPAGVLGVAFLLLRFSGAALLARAGSVHFADRPLLIGVSSLFAVALVAGAGARAVAGFSLLLALLTIDTGDLVGYLAHLSWALSASAVALIGPGAFSIDALLFGRRTIRVKEMNTKV